MKIAIYNKDTNKLSSVYEEINNPKVSGSSIVFDGGEFSGIDDKHLLFEDEVVPPEEYVDALILDKRETAEKLITKEDEIVDLKRQLSETNSLLLDFMESILV